MDIVETLKNMESFHSRKPASFEQIHDAELKLKLKFSKEYIEYILAFGAVSVYGHELTGICTSPRLDVVEVTLEEREKKDTIPKDLYVIKQMHIDDIVIWQNELGEIFQSSYDSQITKIANSLLDFIKDNEF